MKAFLEYFDSLIKQCEITVLPEEVQKIYDALQAGQMEPAKPLLTESGLAVLEYMQNIDTKNLKAKDIADGMEVSSRKVSGAMRKLTVDGFVEKIGANPVVYTLTQKGKDFNIEDYKNNDEE